MDDLDNAPISDKDRTLYAFIKKMVRDSTSIGQEDVDVAHKAGWSDEALYDAITVCSLFQFYNNWVDATGVSDIPALAYEMSGHRLATEGYASGPPPESRHAPRKSQSAKPPKRSSKSRPSRKSGKSTRG
jgi:hypothetical protein